MFGNSYMLEVCRTIGGPDRCLTLTDVLTANDVTSLSVYVSPFTRLRALGLLVPDAGSDEDHRKKWFRSVDSSLWSLARELGRDDT